MNKEKIDQTEAEILNFEVSDEALESAAANDRTAMWTLGACTGVSVCPD